MLLVAAVVAAVMTVLIYMSKEADTRKGWLVVAVAVVAVGAAVHPGLNLPPSSRERGLLL